VGTTSSEPVAVPRVGCFAVSVTVPRRRGYARTYPPPTPPYVWNGNLSGVRMPGPDSESVTSPVTYGRWLPYLSTARNVNRVASCPLASIVWSSNVNSSRSPAVSPDIVIECTLVVPTYPSIFSSGGWGPLVVVRSTNTGGWSRCPYF